VISHIYLLVAKDIGNLSWISTLFFILCLSCFNKLLTFSLCRIVVNDIILCEKSCQGVIDLSSSSIIGPKRDITFINEHIGTINVDGVERVSKRSYLSQNT